MFKTLAKIKSKDKSRKEAPEEGHNTNTTTFKSKTLPKDKEKSKARSNAPKRKKGGNSIIGSPTSVTEIKPSSHENSQTAVIEEHLDVHHLKGKRQISKECEEAVNAAVSEFFDCAWVACAERFFITCSPVTVSLELRNTWLRIVEAEWQDPDMREKQSTKDNRIFKKDEPPLPLAFDTWSRGAIETLPRFKRESVLDPFLRDLDPLRPPSLTSSTTTEDSTPDYLAKEVAMGPVRGEAEHFLDADLSKAEDKESFQNIPEKNRWNFALDKPLSVPQPESEISESRDEGEYETNNESTEEESQEMSVANAEVEKIYTLYPSRHNASINVSTSAIECYSPVPPEKPMRRSKKSRVTRSETAIVTCFSPSQCGGPNRSGVFRLLEETTSQALMERRNTRDNVRTCGLKIEEQEAEDQEDIVQVIKKGGKPKEEDEELVVHPLFEENTHVVENEISISNRLQDDLMRRPSVALSVLSKGTSVDVVTSEITKKFLRRRLIDLYGRFRRQIMRSVASRAKQLEAVMLEEDSFSSSPMLASELSKTSVLSITSKRSTRNRGRALSQSASTMTIGNSVNRSIAKGASADPKVGTDKRKRSVASSATSKKDNFSFKPLMGNVRPSKRDDRRAAGKERQ